VQVVEIDERGECRLTHVGNDVVAGEVPQHVVKPGKLVGYYLTFDQEERPPDYVKPDKQYDYALMGITASGRGWGSEAVESKELLKLWPELIETINILS